MAEKDYAYWVKRSSGLTLILAVSMVCAKFGHGWQPAQPQCWVH